MATAIFRPSASKVLVNRLPFSSVKVIYVAGLVVDAGAGRAVVERHRDLAVQRVIGEEGNVAPVIDELRLPAVAVEDHGGHDRGPAARQEGVASQRRVLALAVCRKCCCVWMARLAPSKTVIEELPLGSMESIWLPRLS